MTGLLSKIYGYFVARRNQKYDSGKAEQVELPIPVISVGNISVGGTGKTPFVIMLAAMMKSIGYKPGIVGRGYKGKSSSEIIIFDGKRYLTEIDISGDEMMLIARNTYCPVVIGNKTRAATLAFEKLDIDSLIIDDGFQHRRLKRDLDIVILDQKSLDVPSLLPKGRLREPIGNITRADILCFYDNYAFDPNKYPKQDFIRIAGKMSTPYRLTDSKSQDSRGLKQLIAVAGIANPDRFVNLLIDSGYSVQDSLFLRDHQHYTETIINKIAQHCKKINIFEIAITEKDAVKLEKYSESLDKNGIGCFVFPYTIEILEGKDLLQNRLFNLRKI